MVRSSASARSLSCRWSWLGKRMVSAWSLSVIGSLPTFSSTPTLLPRGDRGGDIPYRKSLRRYRPDRYNDSEARDLKSHVLSCGMSTPQTACAPNRIRNDEPEAKRRRFLRSVGTLVSGRGRRREVASKKAAALEFRSQPGCPFRNPSTHEGLGPPRADG